MEAPNETTTGSGGSSNVNSSSNNKSISKSDSFSYVTYGMLQKNHDFVDWVRVDLEDDDIIHVENDSSDNDTATKDAFSQPRGGGAATSTAAAAVTRTTSSQSIDASKEMDERAFELFKAQWQEISACDPDESGERHTTHDPDHDNQSETNESSTNSFVQVPIGLGKKILCGAIAPSPESVSFGVFDEHWNVVKLSPRHSNVDMAILLHAASEAGKEDNKENYGDDHSKSDQMSSTANNMTNKKEYSHNKRTYLKDPLLGKEGELPIVPIRRSSQQQFWIKKSVDLFFRKNSIEFFACFPLRFSPRTIYRFDMVHGGVDRNFWHQRKTAEQQQQQQQHGSGNSSRQSVASTRNVGAKLAESRTKIAGNAADLRNSLASRVSTTKDSFWKNLSRKSSTDSREEAGGSNKGAANFGSSNMLGEMRSKMTSNAASMRNSFASRVSTTKETFLNLSNNTKTKKKDPKDSGVEGTGGNNKDIDTTMPAKLSQMKQRMSENTSSMRNSFASKVSATKQSFLNMKNKTNSSGGDVLEESAFATDGVNDTDTARSRSEASMIPTVSNTRDSNQTNAGKSTPAGYFALTIDDAPCRFDDPSHSHLKSVLDLLKKHDAKATFMVISSFLADCHRPDMIRLLKEGHELANHGVRDEPMHKTATSVEAFLKDLDECNARITDLQTEAGTTSIGVRWFRAPQSRYTATMEEGLARRDMYNVMCDAYAACPIVEDGPWIATALSKQIRNGSIAILHMPERCGFREYCLEAMEGLLEDLCHRRNFRCVTVGELERLSRELRTSGSGGG